MGKRVLLIEGGPNIIEAISFDLVRDGWTVHVPADGATAFASARAQPPDVLTLDAMLPQALGVRQPARCGPTTRRRRCRC